MIARFFGARRKAYNWTLEQIKAGIDAYEATGVESSVPPSTGCASGGTPRSRPSA